MLKNKEFTGVPMKTWEHISIASKVSPMQKNSITSNSPEARRRQGEERSCSHARFQAWRIAGEVEEGRRYTRKRGTKVHEERKREKGREKWRGRGGVGTKLRTVLVFGSDKRGGRRVEEEEGEKGGRLATTSPVLPTYLPS